MFVKDPVFFLYDIEKCFLKIQFSAFLSYYFLFFNFGCDHSEYEDEASNPLKCRYKSVKEKKRSHKMNKQ